MERFNHISIQLVTIEIILKHKFNYLLFLKVKIV